MPEVLVIDCGSTNIRAIIVDNTGRIVASAGRANDPVRQPAMPDGYIIWDMERLWTSIGEVCREALDAAAGADVRAVTLTTWGADGAPVREDGSLAYPPICWQDARTEQLAADFGTMADLREVYRTTGYQVNPFNTLLKLIWLRENQPEVMEGTTWMMMPGLLSHRLCGEMSMDPTSAGTTMAIDMSRRTWSPEMLQMAGLSPDFFPRWVEPGEVIGQVTAAAAGATGLPEGIPVTAAGHDTQFAAVGSGAKQGEAILSSGTWEILMLRTDRYSPTEQAWRDGVLTEADAVAGYYNPQLLMMGSGVLEWLRDHFYADLPRSDEAYATLIGDAKTAGLGAGELTVIPAFMASAGPSRRFGTMGTILGLEVTTSRGQVYRAALEGLSFQMRHALEVLGESSAAPPKLVRVVGGGSKNPLWNQLRADITGMPVLTIEQKEATVLGAAMFAFSGIGEFTSLSEAQQAMTGASQLVEPSADRETYEGLYGRYRQVLEDLEGFYGTKH